MENNRNQVELSSIKVLDLGWSLDLKEAPHCFRLRTMFSYYELVIHLFKIYFFEL